ncbi:hypothetical protein [Streptomyces sp. st115]|nr:hypothetical protein [Streptomyces sp. st115]
MEEPPLREADPVEAAAFAGGPGGGGLGAAAAGFLAGGCAGPVSYTHL